MKARIILLEFLILVLVCAASCSRRQSVNEGNGPSSTPQNSQPNWPELGPPTKIEPGILFHEVTLYRAGTALRVWVYLPERREGSVPAILIAPAGSPLIYGKRLGPGDRPEHLPYVRAGFAVIAYDVEGAVGRGAPESEIIGGVKAFRAAGYGVADARLALDYAVARVPEIDPGKVIAAGHSSAATLALLVAASDARIKGCIAYAPVHDVGAHLQQKTIDFFSRVIPDFNSFLKDSSPVNHVNELRCPVFLFHADDDSVVPTKAVTDFADLLKRSNPNVTFVSVASGDHYDSMIGQGIPSGIRWAKSLTGYGVGKK